MKKIISIALAIFGTLMLVTPAKADVPWDIVRVTCIPELGIFHVDEIRVYYSVPESFYASAYKDKKPSDIAQEYGYFTMPMGGGFDYSCKLPFGTYRIMGAEPTLKETDIGADLRVALSMYKDGELILDNVRFSPSINTDTVVKHNDPFFISVLVNGDDSRIEGYIRNQNQIRQVGLGSYKGKRTVFTQKLMDCLVNNNFLDEKDVRSTTYRKCVDQTAKHE